MGQFKLWTNMSYTHVDGSSWVMHYKDGSLLVLQRGHPWAYLDTDGPAWDTHRMVHRYPRYLQKNTNVRSIWPSQAFTVTAPHKHVAGCSRIIVSIHRELYGSFEYGLFWTCKLDEPIVAFLLQDFFFRDRFFLFKASHSALRKVIVLSVSF
jgi:hypothetical protein